MPDTTVILSFALILGLVTSALTNGLIAVIIVLMYLLFRFTI